MCRFFLGETGCEHIGHLALQYVVISMERAFGVMSPFYPIPLPDTPSSDTGAEDEFSV